MKLEKSCGAIVLRKKGDRDEVLLIQQNAGHWGFPKGHVEPGESEIETACREVLEETGVKIKILDEFRQTISYSPARGVMKDVVYFLGTAVAGEAKPQLSELRSLRWVPLEDVRDMITFPGDRALFESAVEHLSSGSRA